MMRLAARAKIWMSLPLICVSPLIAQDLTVTVDEVECIPIEQNAVAWAQVENNQPETEVRLYFRRLHDIVEDVYHVPMEPVGGGRFWGVFPKAEDRELMRHDLERERETVSSEHRWASWWREKEASNDRDPNNDLDDDLIRERASLGKLEKRDWLAEMDDATFEDWLEQQQNEPAEYFTAVHDAQGRRLAQSKTRVTPVREDCTVNMTPLQAGVAENMTVGETAQWQAGEKVFHWLCDGVVTRNDPFGVPRGDEVCRACVIAWWKKKGILIPAAAGAAVITGVILADDDDSPASPTRP